MPLLCLKCDSKVEASLVKPTYWCPGCNKEITKDETYKVGKRFFAAGVGAMLAMAAALNQPGFSTAKQSKLEVTSTLMMMKRQKRKKLKGLKMKQRRHVRQKNLGMKEHRRTKQKGGKK